MKSARRTVALLIVMAIILAAAAGCAKEQMKYSGFLGNYPKFQKGPSGGVALVYVKKGADFSKYNKVMFDQVVFYLSKDAKYKDIQPEQMKELADEFARAAVKEMKGAYPIVAEPGPDVLRVRVAITGIEPGNPVKSGITTVVPVGLVMSVIKKGTTGSYPGVGSASMEAEFLDSSTNERLAAAIDKRPGSKFSGFTKYGAAKEAFEFWAKRLRVFLDHAHGKQE